MAIEIIPSDGENLLAIHLSGTLHKDDYRQFVPEVERAIRDKGKVRMLVEMSEFHGWDAGALWEDVKFDARHFRDIARLAIVGDSKWEKWMAAFCKPFTTAKVKYFPKGQESDARAWAVAAD